MASFSAQQSGAVAPEPGMRAPRLFRRHDDGFTLVEVIWALMLIGLIAMGSLALFLHGMKTVAHMQRQQVAVSLASSAMDAARSVGGGAVNAAGTSGLVKGRSQAAVQAVWDEAGATEATDTADMTMAFDPENGLAAADQWVPVRTTATIANQTYTIDTLVGECYRLRAFSQVSQNCVATNPSPSTDDYVELYRVRVVVRWDEGEAAKGAHTYRVSSLVDPSADATWNTAVRPFAYDDEFSVTVGAAPTFHAIVLNDSVDYDPSGSTPVIIGLTQPSHGSVALNAAQGVSGVVFTPPANISGTVTFRYKVQGTSGEVSADFATVTVHILPAPVQDNFTVEPGLTHELNNLLLTNGTPDRGVNNLSPSTRKTTIVPVWDRSVDMFSVDEAWTPAIGAARDVDKANLESRGITVDNDGKVFYEAPSADNVPITFYYYLVDDPLSGDGLRFPSAEAVEVRITTKEVILTVADASHTINATTNATWHDNIPWRTLTGNAVGNKIRVESITGPNANNNQLELDNVGGLGNGQVLDFRTVARTPGTYQLTYRVVSPAGKVSDTSGVLSIHVRPMGANVTIASNVSTVTNASPQTFTVVPPQSGGASWITYANVGITDVAITTPATCSNLTRPEDQPLQVRVSFSGTNNRNDNKSCTMRFTVVTTDPLTTPPLKSATTTYTLTVNRK